VTPTLFDLPLGLGDAAQLAEVLLDICGAQPKPVTEEQRNRAVARLAGASFGQMRPLISSLERDPVHPAACYVCVDGIENQPLLLRAAPATTPSSGLFPKAILIGRTHTRKQEVVLNAIPFGPNDYERIAGFSEQVNKAFLPRHAGSRAVIVVRSEAPGQTFPLVFAVFRRIFKDTGVNRTAFGISEGQDPAEFYFATVWSAIRAGWREGYALQGPANLIIAGLKRKPFETNPEAVARVIDIPVTASGDKIGNYIFPRSCEQQLV
jgi:hypothetical protein